MSILEYPLSDSGGGGGGGGGQATVLLGEKDGAATSNTSYAPIYYIGEQDFSRLIAAGYTDLKIAMSAYSQDAANSMFIEVYNESAGGAATGTQEKEWEITGGYAVSGWAMEQTIVSVPLADLTQTAATYRLQMKTENGSYQVGVYGLRVYAE